MACRSRRGGFRSPCHTRAQRARREAKASEKAAASVKKQAARAARRPAADRLEDFPRPQPVPAWRVGEVPTPRCTRARRFGSASQRVIASMSTPPPTIRIPSQSRAEGRSCKKATANKATNTTLNLSTGATFEASPTLSARK
jgi:hypothetical protein